MDLQRVVHGLASCIQRIDARRPQTANARTGVSYQAGIGPHPETQAVALIAQELPLLDAAYAGHIQLGVSYLDGSWQECDLCLGAAPQWDWAIKVKMLRLMGDNGKPNDNMLIHILSPYPGDRSALTDCAQLLRSGLPGQKAIVIYGFDYPGLPMDPAIEAFETLAQQSAILGPRNFFGFLDLIHPVHREGRVFGWEVNPL